MWFLYVLETADGTLYTGITTHLARRFQAHQNGRGARYTAVRRPVRFLGAWCIAEGGRPQATRLERQFKQLGRLQKLALLQAGASFQGLPFIPSLMDSPDAPHNAP
jgi:putative endonuclease